MSAMKPMRQGRLQFLLRLLMPFLLSFVLLLTLSGCIKLPTLRQATHEIPTAWPTAQQATPQPTPALTAEWWKSFNDPALNTLIEEAVLHNSDIQLTMARIDEARGNAGITRSAQQIQADVSADADRVRRSQKGSAVIPGGTVNSDFGARFNASYELDLWGRLKEADNAARARLLASQFARDSVRLSLTHAVTQAWLRLRALDAKLAVLQRTHDNRHAALELHTLREKNGLTSALTVHQAAAEMADLDIQLAKTRQAIQQQELQLTTLAGRSPRDLVVRSLPRSIELATMSPLPVIPAGLPAELLQHRPDLRQAEQTFAAAQARLRETKAAIYPRISLTASYGAESTRLADLFSGPAAAWSLGASIAQTLFNGGRTEAALQAEDARQLQALISYETTVRQAFREVLDALIAVRQSREWREAERRREAALQEANTIAELRYGQGLENHLSVLDAQRNLLSSQLNQIEAHHAQLSASADLAKALGGGWAPSVTADQEATQTR